MGKGVKFQEKIFDCVSKFTICNIKESLKIFLLENNVALDLVLRYTVTEIALFY